MSYPLIRTYSSQINFNSLSSYSRDNNWSNEPFFLVVAGQSNALGYGTQGMTSTPDVPLNLRGIMNQVYFWRNLNISGTNFGWADYNCGVNSEPSNANNQTANKWGPEAELNYSFLGDHYI